MSFILFVLFYMFTVVDQLFNRSMKLKSLPLTFPVWHSILLKMLNVQLIWYVYFFYSNVFVSIHICFCFHSYLQLGENFKLNHVYIMNHILAAMTNTRTVQNIEV